MMSNRKIVKMLEDRYYDNLSCIKNDQYSLEMQQHYLIQLYIIAKFLDEIYGSDDYTEEINRRVY